VAGRICFREGFGKPRPCRLTDQLRVGLKGAVFSANPGEVRTYRSAASRGSRERGGFLAVRTVVLSAQGAFLQQKSIESQKPQREPIHDDA
jgi:hypothetical protein